MICIPVQVGSLEELKQKVKKIPNEIDLLEIWVDHLPKTISAEDVIKISSKNIVIVNKPKREKGMWTGSETKRVERLIEFIKAGAEYIDIGIDTDKTLIKQLIKSAQKSKAKIIISYHNFKKTPSPAALQKIIQKSYKLKPDIVKVATFVNKTNDNFILAELLSMHSKNKKFIALGMGPKGIISRVIGLTLGNYINYIAADSKQKSAPGQLSLVQYHKLKDIIKFS